MNAKRMITLLICVAMILSIIPVMTISTSAANEGMWTTYRRANEYPSEDEEEDEEKAYVPAAGYHYSSDGFTIDQPDWTGITPFVTASTKETHPLKDGLYLKFRVDDYSYNGGNNGVDQWICVSFSTEPKVNPGSTDFGGGWLTLIRGDGTSGTAMSQPHLTTPKTDDVAGTFVNHGGAFNEITIPTDENGREIYTVEVNWIDNSYEIKINGLVMPGAAQADPLMESLSPSGDFYVGISLMTTIKDGTAGMTILEYGTSEDDASKPVGEDSLEPESNEIVEAPIADASTVAANQPAILWNPETRYIKGGNNCTFTVLGDNTWRVNGTDATVFFSFIPKSSWSYDAADFPVFGIMFRNIRADGQTLWYSAGDVAGALDSCTIPFTVYDGEIYYGEDDYFFVPFDLEGLWEGRINAVRLDFSIPEEADREFDICFAGMFRSEDEAYVYAEEYLRSNTDIDPDATKEQATKPADDPEEPESNASGDETNASGNETNASGNKTETPKSGCKSAIGFGAVVILAASAAAYVLKKKD